MEAYGWIVSLCILFVMLGIFWWLARNVTKTRWQITLKDGRSFIGRRTWTAMWREGLWEKAYQVVDSQESFFKEGTIVVFGIGTILYRIKQ